MGAVQELRVKGFRGSGVLGSATPLAKKRPVKSKKNFWSSVPKSAVVGFRIAHSKRQNVGWVECNEIQQSLE